MNIHTRLGALLAATFFVVACEQQTSNDDIDEPAAEAPAASPATESEQEDVRPPATEGDSTMERELRSDEPREEGEEGSEEVPEDVVDEPPPA